MVRKVRKQPKNTIRVAKYRDGRKIKYSIRYLTPKGIPYRYIARNKRELKKILTSLRANKPRPKTYRESWI